ncbi:hypothetical protein J3E69DRAFT_132614 [Trichoderma sp. SZMC 28015]
MHDYGILRLHIHYSSAPKLLSCIFAFCLTYTLAGACHSSVFFILFYFLFYFDPFVYFLCIFPSASLYCGYGGDGGGRTVEI